MIILTGSASLYVGVAFGCPGAEKKSESPVAAMEMTNSSLEHQLQDITASRSEAVLVTQQEEPYILLVKEANDWIKMQTATVDKVDSWDASNMKVITSVCGEKGTALSCGTSNQAKESGNGKSVHYGSVFSVC
ncbi:hypothetical protein IGI04_001838 [Brassica rapa subsp. trilocularis]|uniref:Uncharacterized protein n=1 Tax=Brassica rapa subsp. trilocularis TaxID=1813537 RepID=A0ABQ7NTT6_BRACM|nr:hypothetical protein IGI04_011997 [Brassica rapa subsp. trilocularis]KAG5414271.1 hypothetical protein IGI04_001838 [Brassica rapa subsp. trilocularis]